MSASLPRPLIVKEVRALVPIWAAAAAATLLADAVRLPYSLVVYAIGAFTLGAQSVGHEFTHRTLATLLVQPIDRRRLYLVKLAVLAIALTAFAGIGWLALRDARVPASPRWLAILLPAVGGFALAPWMTMWSRHPLGAAIFTGTPPAMLFLAAQEIGDRWHSADTAAAAALGRELWFASLAVLAPVAAVLGWRTFMRLNVIDGPGRALHLPRFLARARAARVRHPIRQLIAKELRLQQITFVTVALFVAGDAILLVQAWRGVVPPDALVMVAVIYCAALALVIGSLASAEERQLGTLESQLMLPLPAWQQWLVKVVVAVGLALALGIVLPMALLTLAPHEGGARMLVRGAVAPMLVVLLTAVGLYVSSLSTSGVRALAVAFPTALGMILLVQWVNRIATRGVLGQIPAADGWGVLVLAGVMLMLSLGLGFSNHHRLERRWQRIWPQAALISAALATGVALMAPL
jgi:ABC-type transport system involved in multi-copper enzyme maturation permease subunit